MYARFTRLTQWEGRIQQLPPPPRYTMKHCRQTTIVMQMQQWARNWGWHGRCILVHYFYQSSRDIGSRRNNAFRHVVIVRSRRSRKPTAHLRPYEYGIPSFVPKDPSVSRAPFRPSLLPPSWLPSVGNFSSMQERVRDEWWNWSNQDWATIILLKFHSKET